MELLIALIMGLIALLVVTARMNGGNEMTNEMTRKRIAAVKTLELEGQSDVIFGCDFCPEGRDCLMAFDAAAADGKCAVDSGC